MHFFQNLTFLQKESIGNFILGENPKNAPFPKVTQMVTLSPPRAGAPVYCEGESPYPSLSGFHDFEPQLEFDDAELLERKQEMDEEICKLEKLLFSRAE